MEQIKVKGKLILIGGNEIKKPAKSPDGDNNQNANFQNGVLNEILKEVTSPNPIIEVVPAASDNQEEMGKKYIEAFRKLKHKASVIKINSRKDAGLPEHLERIEKADIVFFSGGDQSKLEKLVADTPLLEILKRRYYSDDFIIAGTSSGAMIWPKNMIVSGASDEALIKGVIELKKGFGFVSKVVIDTHFLTRGRISRLAEALLMNNDEIGIGICEDTGLVISEGRYLRTVGSGTVVIMEEKSIKNTNYNSVKKNDPIFIENLTMHILAKGAGYDILQQRFLIEDNKSVVKKELQKVN